MVFSRPFQRYVTNPQIPKILVGKVKKYLEWFSDYRAGWSREPQWQNDNSSFSAVFSTSALKESRAFAYYW